jgi:hypothetical protein
MGAPLGSVKAWIRRGLEKLKACLAAGGGAMKYSDPRLVDHLAAAYVLGTLAGGARRGSSGLRANARCRAGGGRWERWWAGWRASVRAARAFAARVGRDRRAHAALRRRRLRAIRLGLAGCRASAGGLARRRAGGVRACS